MNWCAYCKYDGWIDANELILLCAKSNGMNTEAVLMLIISGSNSMELHSRKLAHRHRNRQMTARRGTESASIYGTFLWFRAVGSSFCVRFSGLFFFSNANISWWIFISIFISNCGIGYRGSVVNAHLAAKALIRLFTWIKQQFIRHQMLPHLIWPDSLHHIRAFHQIHQIHQIHLPFTAHWI